MTSTPMMKCGHAAMATCARKDGITYDPPIPSCVICSCTEIDADAPDLTKRMARCDLYGRTPKSRNHESNYGCKRGEPCNCERPSSPDLPFFEYLGPSSNHWKVKKRGEQEFDGFYCGCMGWD